MNKNKLTQFKEIKVIPKKVKLHFKSKSGKSLSFTAIKGVRKR